VTDSAPFKWAPQRAATIEIEQAPNGYWNATIALRTSAWMEEIEAVAARAVREVQRG
jgi:hypothetical protein